MIEAVEGAGSKWVDLRPAFRNEISVDSAKKLFFDYCHPTKSGHQLIAEQIIPTAIEILQIERRSLFRDRLCELRDGEPRLGSNDSPNLGSQHR